MILMWESYSHPQADSEEPGLPRWQWIRAWIMLGIFVISASVVVLPPFVRICLLASFLVIYARPDAILKARSKLRR
jgi:hypothetical protein